MACNDAFARERDAWVQKYGSPHLRRLAAEGIRHNETYRAERLACELPGWRLLSDDIVLLPPSDPPPWAVDMLDRARRQRPSAVLKHYSLYGTGPDEGFVIEQGYTCSDLYLGAEIVFTLVPEKD